jgi:hypothetical protein
MTQEWNTEPIFGKYSVKVTRSELRITASFLRTTDLLSLRSMKRREGVFSPKAQKRYVCKFRAS